jgi:hypothetical protein
MVAGGSNSEVDQGSSLNEYDTSSVETDNLQSTDQTKPITSTYGSGETHLSIARPSEQILALITVSALSLSDAGEGGPAIIDVSKLTTVTVLDKRSSSSGVEYKCEFEPLWLTVGGSGPWLTVHEQPGWGAEEPGQVRAGGRDASTGT